MATSTYLKTGIPKANLELDSPEKVMDKYKKKRQPVVSVIERELITEGVGFGYSWSLTVDNNTGKIYIPQEFQHFVRVFDSNGKHLFKFGDHEGEGKMEFPKNIAIFGDVILISQGGNFILKYTLDGKFISSIGRSGEGELEFYWPSGVAINESNGDIYICDTHNIRIQVLTDDINFKTQFTTPRARGPIDIKLTREFIFVLDDSNPCLHLFSYNYVIQKSVISRGIGMQVAHPWSFFIDHTNNILITDNDSDSLLIFNPKFELIHDIPVAKWPTGVAVDNQGRIIVCYAETFVLQIF